MKKNTFIRLFGATVLLFASSALLAQADIYISEFHYDNLSTDSNENIEIGGPQGSNLNNWSVVLYNGTNSIRAPYNTLQLDGTLEASDECDEGYYVVELPSNGIQNGSPDGIALVDPSGNVVQFISYEGSFEALDGPAAGMTSIDIGVAESNSTPVGSSLQYDPLSDSWSGPYASHFGTCSGASEPTPVPTVTPTPLPSAEPSGEPQLTTISQIQGAGGQVSITDTVIVEAIVTGDFQPDEQLRGFFVQEEAQDSDNNPLTSEAIFVYCGSCASAVDVGDKVRITARPGEYNGMSQLNATDAAAIALISSSNPLPAATTLSLPVFTTATTLEGANEDIAAFYEAYEGMLVTISNTMFATEYYQLGRYGQVVLAADGRFRQFTDIAKPSEQGLIDHQIQIATRRLILDDGSTRQNPEAAVHPQPGLSADNYFRGGDSIEALSGALHFAFGEWRIQPVSEAFDYQFQSNNPRTEGPTEVTGSLKVASFNVLNYFTTLDQGENICGPDQNMGCRGADSSEELARQQAKIVAALCAMDADIVGLMELQNAGPGQPLSPVATLVDAINRQCGEYAAIDTGTLGTDAISVGLIYKPAKVSTIGTSASLDSLAFTDPNNTGTPKNRAALAQSFSENSSKQVLTIAVNHLKSKGSACGPGDDDIGSGQGNCNGTRSAAAELQAAWLAEHPTGVVTDKILVIGDLNAYRYEEPITAFKTAGFVDLIDHFSGSEAYGYVFDGQLGYLDHALANQGLLPFVSAVTEWHINADEINLFDYNSEYKPANYLNGLYRADPYRSSDHDPLIVSIDFPQLPRCNGRLASVYVDAEGNIVGGPLAGMPYQGVLVGSHEDDVIVGTDEQDMIIANKGNDIICAGAGDDYVFAKQGDDSLFGEAGNDLLFGGKGKDSLYGGADYDMVFGQQGADRCRGELRFSCRSL